MGYTTGDATECRETTKIIFVTPMVFVQKYLFDKDFGSSLGLVVLDEVHERGWEQDPGLNIR